MQQIKAPMIRCAYAKALRNNVVKRHHRDAVSAHQPPDDFLDQFTFPFALISG